MAGQGNRIKRDSQEYACQANHYDWAYPREKWTVIGNHFMPVHEIQKEEERLQKEEAANARRSCKRKHAISISFPLEDEDEVGDVCHYDKNVAKDTRKEGSPDTSDVEDAEKYGGSAAAVMPLMLTSDRNDSIVGNNHPELLQQLREKVEHLEKEVA